MNTDSARGGLAALREIVSSVQDTDQERDQTRETGVVISETNRLLLRFFFRVVRLFRGFLIASVRVEQIASMGNSLTPRRRGARALVEREETLGEH